MPVAVFDIDGTLTDTNDVDVECYEAAVLAEFRDRLSLSSGEGGWLPSSFQVRCQVITIPAHHGDFLADGAPAGHRIG